jgi:hypothetical protein
VSHEPVQEAREWAQAQKSQAPERHDPAALPLGDAELQPRRRCGVRGEVAEAAGKEEHKAERQPRAQCEAEHAATERQQSHRHPNPRSVDPPGNDERRGHGSGAERPDDESRPGVRPPVRMREGRRECVHGIGCEADDRDDQQEGGKLWLLPH